MATVVVHHSTTTGADPNPDALVDGPAWDAAHTVTGLENVPNVDTTNADNITSGTLTRPFSYTSNLTGVATAYRAANLIEVSDDVAVTGSTTDYKGRYTPESWYNVSGLTVNWESGSAGTFTGARTPILGNLFLSHASNTSNGTNFYCGGILTSNIYVDDGGAPGSAKGACLGLATVSYVKSTVKHWASVCGAELDVVVESGASVDYKYGVVVSNYNSDAVQGNIDDVAYYFSSQAGSPGWRVGLGFKNSGSSPLSSDGTLIKSLNSATFLNLIDVTSSTITGYLLKTTPLKITGQGAYQVTTGSLSGDAPVMDLRSGAAGTHIYTGMGRTGYDLITGVAANANEFITGTVAGDSVLAFSGNLFLGLNGAASPFVKIALTTGQVTINNLTASSAVATNASKQLVSVTNTGSGNNVLATSPTLVTPDLGTPSACVATNITALNATQLTTGTIPAARTNGHQNGTATNDNAAAGEVGEYMENTASGVALTTATPANVGTITLTPGDWDVDITVGFLPANTTSVTRYLVSLGTTSATISGTIGRLNQTQIPAVVFDGATTINANIVPYRISVATATTTQVWAVVQSTFTVSTVAASGIIRARRVR